MDRERKYTAVVVGIDQYVPPVSSLSTPSNDALQIGTVLKETYNYEVVEFQGKLEKEEFLKVIEFIETPLIDEGSQEYFIFYFAGHGLAQNSENGQLKGFLVPSDGNPADNDSFVEMKRLYEAIEKRNPHHALIILDCCFAGAFKWSTGTRDLSKSEIITKEQFWYFLDNKCWQVITSASYDETALDLYLGSSAREGKVVGQHSPFAYALINGLKGDADIIPKGKRDGIITAHELCAYLQYEFTKLVDDNLDQMPSLWDMDRLHKGHFLFKMPKDMNLPEALPMIEKNNPYVGLKSFEEGDESRFFGRTRVIYELEDKCKSQKHVILIGPSGSGKSSVVKAGLIPRLRKKLDWEIHSVVRPGRNPWKSFSTIGLKQEINSFDNLKYYLGSLEGIGVNKKLLLVIDQFEELITETERADLREDFIISLVRVVNELEGVHILITLRSDFESQFIETALGDYWSDARYFIPKMNRDDLREAILGPAQVASIFFDPVSIVEDIIDEVLDSPGSLPLMSFALSELYILVSRKESGSRTITHEDFKKLNGVTGALRSSATEVYESLPDEAHKKSLQNLFMRMISLEGGERARRRVPLSELNFSDPDENERIKNVIDFLSKARLVTTGAEESGEPYLEAAHDELIRGWDLLTNWIEQIGQENLLLFQRISRAARMWKEDGRKRGGLWTNNPKLSEALNFLKR